MRPRFDPNITIQVPNLGQLYTCRPGPMCSVAKGHDTGGDSFNNQDGHDLRDDSAKTIYLYDDNDTSRLNATQSIFCLPRDWLIAIRL